MTKTDSSTLFFQIYALVAMTLFNTVYILLLRYTRTIDRPMYIATTAVVMAETIKLFSALFILTWKHGNIRTMLLDVRMNVFCNLADSCKMCVPSLVYMVQNNLTIVALTNLDADTYMVTNQFKLLTAAFFSVAMLKKNITCRQWVAVFVLFCGVTFVQIDQSEGFVHPSKNLNMPVGLTAIITVSMCSGFAGVYFEKVLKGTTTSLWIRNVQMYIFGILSALFGMCTQDFGRVLQNGFFHGYTLTVWGIVVLLSIGGLYISLVVKCTDNIIKGFSMSSSIILSSLGCVYLFGKPITLLFCVGAFLVIVAIFMYSVRQDTGIQQLQRLPRRICSFLHGRRSENPSTLRLVLLEA
ncbi:CMP-sialic acid transporter-like [Glandiceps talaboti]